MKGMFLKCNRFYFKDTIKSTRPAGIEEIEIQLDERKFAKCIVILICIEKRDTEKDIEECAKRFVELDELQFYRGRKLIVVPFVHLSNKIGNPKKAKRLCTYLTEILGDEGYNVGYVTFGTHKDAVFDIKGEPASISYFEF